ncbi:Major sperm protein, partial [Trichostrongylus colubriformis]
NLFTLERLPRHLSGNMSKEKKKEAPGHPSGSSNTQPAKDEAYLLNRPGEPEFKMSVTPNKVTFLCTAEKKPVWSDVRVSNPTKDKHSYKVKCTSADIFRVQPPLGFIKPGETGTIRMWFQNKEIPEGHRHYFAIYHIKCAEGKTVKEIWTKSVKPDGVKRIAAVFEKVSEKK